MVKKESATRGYMTQEEVEGHLKNFSESYDGEFAKVKYLKTILQRGKLAPETQKNVRRDLAKVYSEGHNYIDADLTLIENGGEDKVEAIRDLKARRDNERAAEILVANDELEGAANIYSSIGNHFEQQKEYDKASAAFAKAIDLKIKLGENVGNMIHNYKLGLYESKDNRTIKYASLLEKAAENEGGLGVKLTFLKSAQERYQKAGNVIKALSIGKKLGPLEQKLKAENERLDKYWASKDTVETIISTLGILGGLFFLSPNLTGNAISNMTTQTASWIGAVLIVIGIIALYFLMKAKKRTSKKQEQMIPIKKTSKKKKR